MIRSTAFAVLLCAFAVPAVAAAAKVYKCPGPSGSSVFSQFPCSEKPVAPIASVANAQTVAAATEERPQLSVAECTARSRDITERFSNDSAEATSDIRRLREQMATSGGYSADKRANALRVELTSAEDRLDAAGRIQRRSQLDLRQDCDGRGSGSASASLSGSRAYAR